MLTVSLSVLVFSGLEGNAELGDDGTVPGRCWGSAAAQFGPIRFAALGWLSDGGQGSAARF